MSSPIPNFTRLSDSISLYRPEKPQPTSGHPSLIVLCTWMAAAPKHIAKYISQYRILFPQTSILLIQCSLPAIFYSSTKQSRLLEPARHIILSTPGAQILHAFSNGGGTIACHLATQLKSHEDWTGFEKVILDCTPSIPTVSGAVDAISFSLPSNPILRVLGRWLLRTVIFTYLLLFVKLARKEDGVHWIRRTLNDDKVFGTDAERLYVYSRQDALVQDWAVAAHAEDARQKDYSVREERFEKGAHCALGVGEGGERYWKTVEDFLGGRK